MTAPTMFATPITWNARLGAWDDATLDALKTHIENSKTISTPIADLFARTMQWGETHPFSSANTPVLLDCWTVLMVESNVPWDKYDKNAGVDFLPVIARSDPPGMLAYLNARVHESMENPRKNAAWIAQALHLACLMEADSVAPLMEKLAQQWSWDLDNNRNVDDALGQLGMQLPWNQMHEIHAKFQAYPDIQDAVMQWDGVCTAERIVQAPLTKEGPGSPQFVFSPSPGSSFHAKTLALPGACQHVQKHWGLLGAGPTQEVQQEAQRAMEATWKMLRGLADNVELYDRNLLQQAGGLCMDCVPGNRRIMRFEKTDAVLLSGKSYFVEELHGYMERNFKAGTHSGMLMLETLASTNTAVQEKFQPLVAQGAKDFLLDFMEKAGNAVARAEMVPHLMSYLKAHDIVELSLDTGTNQQRLFWRAVALPQHLNKECREDAIQTPQVQRAIVLATLLESHGVEQWGLTADPKMQWLNALARWYPDHAVVWEHVARETLRAPNTANDVLLRSVFDVQGIPAHAWDVIKHMVDAPAKNSDARQALSDVRAWQLGLPQNANQLVWVESALRNASRPSASVVLPCLDEPCLK